MQLLPRAGTRGQEQPCPALSGKQIQCFTEGSFPSCKNPLLTRRGHQRCYSACHHSSRRGTCLQVPLHDKRFRLAANHRSSIASSQNCGPVSQHPAAWQAPCLATAHRVPTTSGQGSTSPIPGDPALPLLTSTQITAQPCLDGHLFDLGCLLRQPCVALDPLSRCPRLLLSPQLHSPTILQLLYSRSLLSLSCLQPSTNNTRLNCSDTGKPPCIAAPAAACLAAGIRGAVSAPFPCALACSHQDMLHFLLWHLLSASPRLPAAVYSLRQCGTPGSCPRCPTHLKPAWPHPGRDKTPDGVILSWMHPDSDGGHLDMLVHGRRLPVLNSTSGFTFRSAAPSRNLLSPQRTATSRQQQQTPSLLTPPAAAALPPSQDNLLITCMPTKRHLGAHGSQLYYARHATLASIRSTGRCRRLAE